ncbi:type II toxin-antitoxin system ParD family antitoxin [Gemmata obscuriglobus]|uniref:Type II toxin-antitoxin system ParD family antitoxin n=1 Tax=Gemmata obscuriglobus TaxID=114 RepID=A0A2Z3HHD9_9BACT|nr:type II toxin-antitoxin system ParD family antitoxin [Gemmata obscuriglobus]AWM42395.1 type II toxin-antitoxin system ParD family antitoxin [Gemmata obscuriglobus]
MSLNVSLPPHLEAFVQQTVRDGRFQSASEVVRAALRLLEEREQAREACLEWLRGEIRRGLDSGPAEPFEASFWSDLRDDLQARGDGSARD